MSKARDIADLDFNSPDIDGGNIDGATIGGTTPAAGTFSQVNVDNFTLDGTKLSLSSGDMTLDSVAGDIVLDAHGNQILFKGSQGQIGFIDLATGRMDIKASNADADMRFQGNDGGVAINALTLDMSAAGAATFNSTVAASSYFLGNSNEISLATGSSGNIFLRPNGQSTSGQMQLASDGAATFSGDVTLAASKSLTITSGQLELGANYKVRWGGSNNYSIMSDNNYYVQINANGQDGLRVSRTESTFNEGGIDRDFRVESNGNANMLFVDGGANYVGIGAVPSGTYGRLTVAGGVRTVDDLNSKIELGRYSAASPNSYIKLGANSDSFRITNKNDSADIFILTNAGAATFSDDVIADAFLPTTSGAYGSNHVGVHSSGVVLNAATGQTGYIMSAGSAAMTFGPTGSAIQLGGLTTANKLDDYEEGDFTLVLSGDTTAGTNSGGSIGGRYTKIGRLVTCNIVIANTTLSGAAGTLTFTGFPFVPANYANRPAIGVVRTYQQDLAAPSDGYFSPVITINHNVNSGVIVQTKDNGTWSVVQVENTSGLYFEGTITYPTA